MAAVIVGGALANKYRNGGGAWERMSWVKGLQHLGHDVYFVEQIAPHACVDAFGSRVAFAESVNLEWFLNATKYFDVDCCSALVYADGEECAGMSWSRLIEISASADLLVNLSGHITLPALLDRIRCKAYIDVDPGFTQFWHADPDIPFQVCGHDLYFTIGENIGRSDCEIPTGGIDWKPVRQPVVLKDWPVSPIANRERFTTIASWRGGFGPIHFNGRNYGLKVHEFRKCFVLPKRVADSPAGTATFEIALQIDPQDIRDLESLRKHGWLIADPGLVAGDPAKFREYIQGSSAEFSVAQGIYTEINSGWFSDRTIRYLASGKPALVQDTGFSRNIPVGGGVVPFRTLDEAVCGARSIVSDYNGHCHAAREIAQEYFDSDKVLSLMMQQTSVVSG